MRFDTLATTRDSALAAFDTIEINEEFPTPISEEYPLEIVVGDLGKVGTKRVQVKLLERYNSYRIYESINGNYYTLPSLTNLIGVTDSYSETTLSNIRTIIDNRGIRE